MSHDVDAIYDQGVFRPLAPLVLAEGTRVHLHVEPASAAKSEQTPAAPSTTAKLRSPRLAHPEQAVDFQMEVSDASL